MKNLLYILFLLPTISFSQMTAPAIDSMAALLPSMKDDSLKVNALNLIAQNLKKIDPLRGKNYAQNALTLSERIHWNNGIATSYRSFGVICTAQSDFENAMSFFDKGLKATSNKVITSRILRGIAKIYTEQGNFAKALEYNNECLRLCEETGDRQGQAIALSNISVVYIGLGNIEKAKEYRNKSITIDKSADALSLIKINVHTIDSAKSNKVRIHQKTETTAFEKELDSSATAQNATALTATALVSYDAGEFEKALFYNEKAMIINRKISDRQSLSYNLQLQADIFYEQAKRQKQTDIRNQLLARSQTALTDCINIQSNLHLLMRLSNAYKTMSLVQNLQGNFKGALGSYQKSIVFRDSVFNNENRETIKNLEDKRTIELRDKQILLNNLTIKSDKNQKLFYLFGIVLLGSIGLLLTYQNRLRKKSNNLLIALNGELDAANKTKTRFFSILNHDLRSPVAHIIQFLHLHKEVPELDLETKTRLETKTISSAENLLETMEDLLLWSKGQMENFRPDFRTILIAGIFADIYKDFEFSNVTFTFENHQNLAIYSDENFLKTIARNLTSNAIKVLENTIDGEIIWKADKVDSGFLLTISDNGPGGINDRFRALYDDKEVVGINSGLGLHLVRDLAKAINCTVSVETNPGKGTTFFLFIKS